jgi:PAT family beta-lactamase induction signal transducer AmpG
MIALNDKEQALFTGIRTTAYRLAMLFTSGALVFLAGWLERSAPLPFALGVALCGAGAVTLLINTYHVFVMPRPGADGAAPAAKENGSALYGRIFKSFFTQQNIIYILVFVLIFNFGDAMMSKMMVPFLLRPAAEGALAMPVTVYSIIKGVFGMFVVLGGNILGGFFISKYGFKKCIWPVAAVFVLPNFLYAYMAFNPASVPLPLAAGIVLFERFGDGIGYMAITCFMLIVSRGEYKTSFYAIITGLMQLGVMLPSMLSGYVFKAAGGNYFYFMVLAGVLSLTLTFTVVPLVYRINKVKESDALILQKQQN